MDKRKDTAKNGLFKKVVLPPLEKKVEFKEKLVEIYGCNLKKVVIPFSEDIFQKVRIISNFWGKGGLFRIKGNLYFVKDFLGNNQLMVCFN